MENRSNMKLRGLLVIALLVMSPLVFSQGDTPPPPAQQGPPGLPVDGAIISLVIAGLFYGVKKSLKKK